MSSTCIQRERRIDRDLSTEWQMVVSAVLGSILFATNTPLMDFLRENTLSPNLVQLGHLGLEAFDVADRNMRKLQVCAQQSFGADGTASISCHCSMVLVITLPLDSNWDNVFDRSHACED